LASSGRVETPKLSWIWRGLVEVVRIVGEVFIRKCERMAGKLVNTWSSATRIVSQFWTYNEKEFLANPVYARDYPLAKNLER
jgi:hypothetical protein